MSNPYGPPGGDQPGGTPQWDASPWANQYGANQQPGYPEWGGHQQAPQNPGYRQPAYQHWGTQQWGQTPPQAQPYPYPGAPQHGFTQPGHPHPGVHGGHSPARYGFGPQPPDTFADPAGQSTRTRSRWPWFLGGLGVLAVVVVLFLGFVAPGWFVRTVLDAGAVQKGVERILVDSYGIEDVESVTCPSGQQVEKGHAFTCQVTINGQRKSVRITIRNSEGNYEVSRPR